MDKSIWDRRYTNRDFVWTVQPNQCLVQEVERLPAGRQTAVSVAALATRSLRLGERQRVALDQPMRRHAP
jgi:hypothetical protein